MIIRKLKARLTPSSPTAGAWGRRPHLHLRRRTPGQQAPSPHRHPSPRALCSGEALAGPSLPGPPPGDHAHPRKARETHSFPPRHTSHLGPHGAPGTRKAPLPGRQNFAKSEPLEGEQGNAA